MVTKGLICNRCKHNLTLIDTYNIGDEDYGNMYLFRCYNCGAEFECTEVSEQDKKNYDFYKDGKEDISGRIDDVDIMNGHCINCGSNVSMSNNFMLSDYDDTIKDDDDDKMNFVLGQCPYCGMQEVRWDTAENDKKKYPYWKGG